MTLVRYIAIQLLAYVVDMSAFLALLQTEMISPVAANVAVERIRRVRREWTFDLETGELYAMGEFVDLVVDLEARRAVEIPEGFRTALSRFLHPELAHD